MITPSLRSGVAGEYFVVAELDRRGIIGLHQPTQNPWQPPLPTPDPLMNTLNGLQPKSKIPNHRIS